MIGKTGLRRVTASSLDVTGASAVGRGGVTNHSRIKGLLPPSYVGGFSALLLTMEEKAAR